MSLHEDLSRLASDDLDPEAAAALRSRIATEPEVARAWEAMLRLTQDLSSLPELAPPAPVPAPRLRRVPWLPLVAAASAAIGWFAHVPPASPTVVAEPSGWIASGALTVSEGPLKVTVDGVTRLSREPAGPLARETAQEDPMHAPSLVGGAALGALLTVAVYEGTATLEEEGSPPVTLGAGERVTRPLVGAPDPSPGTREGRASDPVTAGTAPATAEARIAELEQQLAQARYEASAAGRTLEALQGVPTPWPDDVPGVLRPDGFPGLLGASLDDDLPLSLEAVFCEEFPCFALLTVDDGVEDLRATTDALVDRLKAAGLPEGTGVLASVSQVDGPEGELHALSLGLIPAEHLEDDGIAQRLDYRARQATEDALFDRQP